MICLLTDKRECVLLLEESLCFSFPYLFWKTKGKTQQKTVQCLFNLKMKKQTSISKCHIKLYMRVKNLSRGVFRIQSNIKPFTTFTKKFHLRCLTGFYIRLWHLA